MSPGVATRRTFVVIAIVVGGTAGGAVRGRAQTADVAVMGVVRDSASRPIRGAAVEVLPDGPRAVTRDDGRFVLRGLRRGDHRLFVRRLGYQPAVSDVSVETGTLEVEIELELSAQRLAPQIVSARRERLPRVYERMDEGLGVTMFAEDLETYRGQSLTDLFDRFMPRFRRVLQAPVRCGKEIYFVDGVRTPPVAWEKSSPPPTIGDFVTVEDIDAVEVLRSADFVDEDFLVDSDLSTAGALGGGTAPPGAASPTRSASGSARQRPSPVTQPSSTTGVINMGSPLPGSRPLSTSCRRVVLIWTKYYAGQVPLR